MTRLLTLYRLWKLRAPAPTHLEALARDIEQALERRRADRLNGYVRPFKRRGV